ncbi:DNA methyltransferase [Verrucosispora sp. TAA-831]|uniref:DNA methyltransferase n=1 Tax=Verrucosispora sp. TAA-831 TaxID=3422227 RepID=UPI003D6FF37C
MIEIQGPSYRMFEYEQVLLNREVEQLAGAAAAGDGATIDGSQEWSSDRIARAIKLLIERSTYLSAVRSEGQDWQPTAQATIEGKHWQLRGGGQRRKQSTRFGVHGIHEYRGKFNPQMARALINVVDPDANSLLDPFCGSGTTLVEGLRLSMSVAGIDLSPIAHHIATVKTQALLHHDHEGLTKDLRALKSQAAAAMKVAQDEDYYAGRDPLSTEAARYLTDWFTSPALAALRAGLSIIRNHSGDCTRLLAGVALSSILRDVSLQVPEDLRVRRRPTGFVAPSLAELFKTACEKIEVGLEELAETPRAVGSVELLLGSSHNPGLVQKIKQGTDRRLIVTSPPYATALPYIDTDRLSLIALGLVDPNELRPLEASLVGSREWNKAVQKRWADARSENAYGLPRSVTQLLQQLDERNKTVGAGFRRAAVPTLLYRYFAQMGEAFNAWSSGYLRPGERAVLVVGRNRTGPADDRILIDTPRLLADVAELHGFAVRELIPFETWPRYGLHSSNGVNGEDAVVLARA